MKYSEPIEGFLNFLRDAQESYNIAALSEKEADEETQDILHSLELNENTYHDGARLSVALDKLSGDYIRGYTKAIQDLQEVFTYIQPDLRHHHKNINAS